MVLNHVAFFTLFFSNLALHMLSDNTCISHCIASISYMQASINNCVTCNTSSIHFFNYRYCIMPVIWYDSPYMLYIYIFHDIPNYFYFKLCHYNMFIHNCSWFMICNIIHKLRYMAQNITSHENIYWFQIIFIFPFSSFLYILLILVCPKPMLILYLWPLLPYVSNLFVQLLSSFQDLPPFWH